MIYTPSKLYEKTILDLHRFIIYRLYLSIQYALHIYATAITEIF